MFLSSIKEYYPFDFFQPLTNAKAMKPTDIPEQEVGTAGPQTVIYQALL